MSEDKKNKEHSVRRSGKTNSVWGELERDVYNNAQPIKFDDLEKFMKVEYWEKRQVEVMDELTREE